MGHHESCDTISEEHNVDSPSRSQVAEEEIRNCSTEKHSNSTDPPNPISDHDCINFSIGPEILENLVEVNSIRCLHQYGGISGIASALQTNLLTGISGDQKDLRRRHERFGSNMNLEEKLSVPAKGFLYRLVLDSLKDTTVILLLCCATLSLAIGIARNGLEEGFLDGAILFLAILMVINFGAIFRFCRARRINKLSRGKDVVGILRHGKMQRIPVSEIVVGDIICLMTGDRVPADGLFIHGDSFKLDDDSVQEAGHNNYSKCPCIFTGARVVGGYCHMLVTSVGSSTENGKLMRSTSCCHQSEESKLQTSIDMTNSRLEKILLGHLLLALLVQVLRCFVWKSDQCDENHDPDPKGVKNTVEEIMTEVTKLVQKQGLRFNGLVAVVCLLIYAFRDGLPLATFIIFAYASKKMLSHHAMVQKLPASATIGLVTTAVCTGETDDLALPHMKMAELWIGFDNFKEEAPNMVAHDVLNSLREGLCMNKFGSEEDDAILFWGQRVLGIDIEEFEQSRPILLCEASNLNSYRRGILLRRNEDGGHKKSVYHWRGTPDTILPMCSQYVDIYGKIQTLDDKKRAMFKKLSEGIESDCLQCFAFAYKEVVIEEAEEEEEEDLKHIDSGLTLIGLVALKNPYAVEVRRAIEACRESGVKIKLVVDGNINMARFMAINSNILRPEEDVKGAVIEASEFRNISEEDRMKVIENIRVMANTSPSDKLSMVQCLRRKGQVVAITGSCSRDSSSLKEADVGLCGHNAAEAARESSDIVILDLNFVKICEILKLGRCVCHNLKKFIQSQLILNIVAFYINWILVVSTSEAPLSPFQLLWVNLIMDVFGALGMAASVADSPPPSDQIQFGGGVPFIAKNMWRNIVVQSLYQVAVLLILDLKGKAVLDVDAKVLKAMIFNCYGLCQIFVLISARFIKKKNVLEGLLTHNNWWFLLMVGFIAILQVAAIEVPAAVIVHAGRLDVKQWCVCMGIAALSMPIGWATSQSV